MPNYLVTGGAGFIGSNVVEELVRQGKTVSVLDNCSTGSLSNLETVIDEIEFVQGDIRDLPLVREAVKGIDYVIHQAALSSVAQSIDDPLSTNDVNVTGTLNIMIASKDANVKRVVYASSASVYGNSQILPKREDMPANPLSPYALSKYMGEQYCKLFHELYGLETLILRYFNVFGPGQACNSHYSAAIPMFMNSFLGGSPPTIFGDGEQSRDLVFVDDVVRANLLACHAKDAAGEIFNIACGTRTTINTLVAAIRNLIGSDIQPIYVYERRGDVRHSQADITKAREILGYEPLFSLEKGLEITIDWFEARKLSSSSYSRQAATH